MSPFGLSALPPFRSPKSGKGEINSVIFAVFGMTEVFLKQKEGVTKILKVDLSWTGEELVEYIWKEAKNPNKLSLEDWMKRNIYVCCGRNINSKTLKDQNIQEHVTVSEIPKSATLSFNYDHKTEKWDGDLMGEEDISDPFLLNPGCLHTVSRSQLRLYLDKDKKIAGTKTRGDFLKRVAKIASTKPTCWICRKEISLCLIGDACSDTEHPRPNVGEESLIRGMAKNSAYMATLD